MQSKQLVMLTCKLRVPAERNEPKRGDTGFAMSLQKPRLSRGAERTRRRVDCKAWHGKGDQHERTSGFVTQINETRRKATMRALRVGLPWMSTMAEKTFAPCRAHFLFRGTRHTHNRANNNTNTLQLTTRVVLQNPAKKIPRLSESFAFLRRHGVHQA